MAPIAGTSLASLAVALARELGPYYQGLVVTSLAPGGNQAVSAQLIDTEAPPERYGGYYLFSHGPSVTGEQHRVLRAGFAGASGTLSCNGSFSAQSASGTTMSLLGVIPMISQDGLLGLRECINRTLRKLWIRVRLPVVSQGSSITSYDLGARWWMSKKRVSRLLDPEPVQYTGAGYGTGTRAGPSSTPYDIASSGETWVLELGSGMPAGQTFYLDCEAPANSRLYTASTGAWTDQASPVAGMGVDNDACLGEYNALFQASLYETIKALAVQAGGARKGYWEDRLAEQRQVVSAIKLYEMDSEPWTLGEGPTVAPSSISWGDKGWSTLW